MTITPRTRCLVRKPPFLKLNSFTAKKGYIERETAEVHGRKDKTGKVQLGYINDIHVMDVSFARQTMQFLDIRYRIDWYDCHTKQLDVRITMA